MRIIAAILIGIIKLTSATTYTDSLSDCQAFAALFSNTCNPNNAAVSFASVATQDHTCTGNVGSCSAGTTNDCTWTRKLCVTCSVMGGATYIRVQTNGMPNHCYKSPNTAPLS